MASKDSDSDEIAAYTRGGQHIKIERPPVRIEKKLTLEDAKAEICDETGIDSYLDLHTDGPSKLFNG